VLKIDENKHLLVGHQEPRKRSTADVA